MTKNVPVGKAFPGYTVSIMLFFFLSNSKLSLSNQLLLTIKKEHTKFQKLPMKFHMPTGVLKLRIWVEMAIFFNFCEIFLKLFFILNLKMALSKQFLLTIKNTHAKFQKLLMKFHMPTGALKLQILCENGYFSFVFVKYF